MEMEMFLYGVKPQSIIILLATFPRFALGTTCLLSFTVFLPWLLVTAYKFEFLYRNKHYLL